MARTKILLPIAAAAFTILVISNRNLAPYSDQQYTRKPSRQNFLLSRDRDGEEALPSADASRKLTVHKKIDRHGTQQQEQRLKGSVVDVRGIRANISSNITTELVFSFSPETEHRFSEKLVDPNHEQKVYANSPAMIWDGEKFVVVMRMWLDKEHTLDKVANTFSDNYFYLREYNSKMEAIDMGGQMLGMPIRVNRGIGDGPIEPRMFPFYNKTYISFNSAVYVNKKLVDTTMLWNLDTGRFIMPELTDGQPQLTSTEKILPRDKHWSPYTHNGQLYMIYSLDPLRIISCDESAKCHFTQNEAGAKYKFHDLRDSLRGGTPTLHYKDEYYITLSHSTFFKKNTFYKRYYAVNLVVLKMTGKYDHRVVYLSENIKLHPDIMNSVPMVRYEYIEDPFLFPVSLLLEDSDSIIIGGHINDHSSYLFRVKGVKNLMDKIIGNSHKLRSKGPKPYLLQNLTRQFAMDETGYTFMS